MVYLPTFTIKIQPFNVSKHPMGILLDPMGHVIISGFGALPARKSKKKRLEIHPEKCRNPLSKIQASHGSESLHLENWAREKHTCFYNSLLKTEEQWNDITSGPVKTSVTVGKIDLRSEGTFLNIHY